MVENKLENYRKAATDLLWRWISSLAKQNTGEQLDQAHVMFCKNTFRRWSKELEPNLEDTLYCPITKLSELVETAELLERIDDPRLLAKTLLNISRY